MSPVSISPVSMLPVSILPVSMSPVSLRSAVSGVPAEPAEPAEGIPVLGVPASGMPASGYALWPGAVSRAVCAGVVAAIEAAEACPGRVLRHGEERHDAAMRNCTEHALSHAAAAAVRQALLAVAAAALPDGAAMTLDGPRFCRYRQGGHFRAHRDRSNDHADIASVRGRRISLVCLLNDGGAGDGLPAFDGGTLVLYPASGPERFEPVNAPLRAGSIIAFPSDLLHEVRPVRVGTRYSAVAWLVDVCHATTEPTHAEPF